MSCSFQTRFDKSMKDFFLKLCSDYSRGEWFTLKNISSTAAAKTLLQIKKAIW